MVIYQKKNARGKINEKFYYGAHQFHGQFCHGCRKCPGLPSYMAGLSKEEVLEKSEKVDQMQQGFFSALFKDKARVSFQISHSCHRDEPIQCPFTGIRTDSVANLFRTTTDPWLRYIVSGFPAKKKIDLKDLLGIAADPQYTCLAVIDAHIDPQYCTNGNQFGYIWTRKDGHYVAANQSYDPVLLDGRTITFLARERGLHITRAYHVFVMSTSPALQPFFKEICRERTQLQAKGSDILAATLKNVGCVFIGTCTSYRLIGKYVTVRDSSKPIRSYSATSRYEFKEIGKSKWQYITRVSPLNKGKSSHMPIGICAVLWAKYRLLEFQLFLEQTLIPTTYRIVSISTDEIGVCLSREKLEDCVEPACAPYFYDNLHKHLRPQAAPGYLKVDRIYMPSVPWHAEFHGAKRAAVSTGREALCRMEETTAKQAFPHHLAPYRNVVCSYGSHNHLFWTIPY
jgi:hypothetical protein